MTADQLPVATKDEQPAVGTDLRAMYRAAVALFATTLVALLLGRGYGLEPPLVSEGGATRRTEGEWVSVPWQLVGSRSPHELQLHVDPSACARVVRYEVHESTESVEVTVWRRQQHASCVALAVVVRLRAPLGDRAVRDGGAITS